MYYQDNFSKTFQEEVGLHQYLAEVETHAWWERVPCKSIEVLTAEGNAESVTPISGAETDEVLSDTMKHTQLLVKAMGNVYLLGGTALPTIQRRARISGNALSEVKKPILAYILNECLGVSKGKALLRFFEGKIRAIHSGDPKDYSIIHMMDIFMAASAYVNGDFEDVSFAGGFTDHSLTTAAWSVKDERMLEAYRDLMKQYGREAQEQLKTEIRITTSDVAASGANVCYSMKEGENTIVLGKALKTIHRGRRGIDEVEENIRQIFEFYKETLRGMGRLFGIQVKYPANAMVGIMKSVGIGKKLIAETVERFKTESGNQACTAYDAYCGICQVLSLAKEKGTKERAMLELEEDISKCITKKWSDYDIPGEIRY